MSGGAPEHVIAGDRVVSRFDVAPDGQVISLVGDPLLPAEVFSGLGAALRQITTTNAAWLAKFSLSAPEKIRFKSRDGTAVEAFHPFRQCPLLHLPHHMNANTLVPHEDVADPENQRVEVAAT